MSMDFISGLPLADGYDSIAIFVDTFTKQAHFLPCTAKINAKELSRLYFNNTFKHHGLSRCIISDRDPPSLKAECTVGVQAALKVASCAC